MTSEEQNPILHSPPVGKADKRMTAEIDRRPKVEHNYWISILCMLFGIGTWLPVNAVYSQLPLFVQFAPEKWNLPSYISLLVQCANIAPLLYYLFHKKLAERQSILICLFLVLGTSSIFGLAFTYHINFFIFGAVRSFYFFFFTFFLSAVGCVSSVLFLPFMNKLPELYLVPYFIGEGLSGLIPGVIALIQGVSTKPKCDEVSTTSDGVVPQKVDEPLFSSEFFLIIIGGFMILSTVSFVYLNYVSDFIRSSAGETETRRRQRNNSTGCLYPIGLSKTLFVALLSAQTLINFFSNGILPSIQSYSCLPYGSEAYHWSVNLHQIINPVVTYFAFFLPVVSLRLLSVCGVFEVICLVYELVTASTSPSPPLVGTNTGVILIVFTWMLGAGLISYMKLSIAAILRREHQKGLFNYGLFTQVGSAAGSLISFIMVNYLKLFHSAESC